MKLEIFYVPVLAAVLACGCGQKMDELNDREKPGEVVTLGVSIPVSGTKVTDVSGEGALNSLQVFVFRKDGTLEAEAREEAGTLSLSCTTGDRDVYAVTNAPLIEDVMSLDDLKTKLSYLSENSPGSFVMSGSRGVKLTQSTSVEIEVKRLVARICIRKITNNFTLEQYRTGAIRLKGIYLLNVQSAVKYLGTVSVLLWSNLHTFDPGMMPDLLYSGALDEPLDYGSPYDTANYFYCYPNPVQDDTSEQSADARYTRLVVELDLNGTSYYYPVSIPGIERNKHYEISELTITRLGSSSPDEPVSSLAASFTLKVKDWEEGTTLEPVI